MPFAVALVPALKSSRSSTFHSVCGLDEVRFSASCFESSRDRPASSIVTFSPRFNNALAAATPVGPEPMMKCLSLIIARKQFNQQQVRANIRRVHRDTNLFDGSRSYSCHRKV